jgi:predicted phosphoadenosine phosphosulfate sulfurtransferase
MNRRYLDIDVLAAARQRISDTFDEFEHVYVSFSAGKDSGVALHLVLDEARRRGRLPLDVLLVDLEAQYQHTIAFAERMMSHPDVRPHWVCLPIHLRNAVSQIQPHWLCWDDTKQDAWVRPLPALGIHDENHFPFFRRGMEFEEFVPEFAEWIAQGRRSACVVGIRTTESLNRWRTIVSETKESYRDWHWSTRVTEHSYNVYPIYDWRTEDIWTAVGKLGMDYNKIYDLMHLAGLSPHAMRICQPYGDDQRRGLYLFKILEPQTWARVVNRVEGANTGNKYSENDRHTLGNFKVHLPAGHTYESYARFLLDTMPPYLSEHYWKKINRFFEWWAEEGHKVIPDSADAKLESQRKVPSWRRIVKVLLKNDYWCKGLSFSQTKREMERQLQLVSKYSEY